MRMNVVVKPVGSRKTIAVLVLLAVAVLLLGAGAAVAGTAPGTVMWYQEDISNDAKGPPAIGPDGTIYEMAQDGNLYAFNPSGPSNTPKWILPLGTGTAGYTNAPAIGPYGKIYVATGDGFLFAVTDDITTGAGAVLWQYPAASADALGSFYATPAIGADGTIYVGSGSPGHLYAISPPQSGGVGTLKWTFSPNDSNIDTSPAIGVDGTIYVASWLGHVYAINPANGAKKWQYPKAGSPAIGLVDSSPAIGADGTIYVGSQENGLSAIKPDGTLKWAFTSTSTGTGVDNMKSPVIGPDGTIYIGNEGTSSHPGFLRAILDTGTQGALKWEYQIPAPSFDPSGYYGVSDTPAVNSNGVIYFGASDGQVYALTDNGVSAPPTVNWTTIVATTNPDDTWETGEISSSPAIGTNGTVYIGSAGQDRFYAIAGDSTGVATSPWPAFHNGMTRTGAAQPFVDLIESAIPTIPATAVLGKTFSIVDTAKNTGSAPSTAASTTRYYLSASRYFDGTATLLTGERPVPVLAPGATSKGTSFVTAPTTMSLGKYYAIACANDKNPVAEGNIYDNCTASTTKINLTAINLVEVSLAHTPAMAVKGKPLQVTDRVQNKGTALAGPTYTRYYFSATSTKDPSMILGGRNVPALPAKAISQGTAALKIPPTIPLGNYYLVACADDNKVLPETAEDDNCISSQVVYGAPDLTETLVSVSSSTVVKGHIVTIVDTVTNGGNAGAGASTTRYYLSTSTDIAGALRLGAKAVPALAAGVTSPKVPKALTIPVKTTPGDYHLIFCADDLSVVSEADETNNCVSTPITVNAQVTK